MKCVYRLALVAMLVVISSCSVLQQAVKKPKLAFDSFRLGQASQDSVELIPRVSITNTNAFAIPVDGIGYALKLNGRDIFDGALKGIGTLESRKAKTVDIPVRLHSETLDFFVNSLLEDKSIAYQVAGDASIRGLRVPFEKQGMVFLPEISLGELSFSEINLSNIAATLPLRITNNNEFAIPFAGMSYAVSRGGKQLFANAVGAQTIEQGKQTTIAIPITINPSTLVTSASQLLQNPIVDVDIEALVDLGFTQIPLTRTASLKLR